MDSRSESWTLVAGRIRNGMRWMCIYYGIMLKHMHQHVSMMMTFLLQVANKFNDQNPSRRHSKVLHARIFWLYSLSYFLIMTLRPVLNAPGQEHALHPNHQ